MRYFPAGQAALPEAERRRTVLCELARGRAAGMQVPSPVRVGRKAGSVYESKPINQGQRSRDRFDPSESLFATVLLRCHDNMFAAYRFGANKVLFAYESGSKQAASTSRVQKEYFPSFP